MKTNKQRYLEGKEKAINAAIEYQNSFSEGQIYYWSEIIELTEHFTKLAKRYGLIKEFRENGII